jgi:hypothetical protein
MRRRISSKSHICTEGMDVYAAGISGKVGVHGMPVRILVTQGTTADCTQAEAPIDGLEGGLSSGRPCL